MVDPVTFWGEVSVDDEEIAYFDVDRWGKFYLQGSGGHEPHEYFVCEKCRCDTLKGELVLRWLDSPPKRVRVTVEYDFDPCYQPLDCELLEPLMVAGFHWSETEDVTDNILSLHRAITDMSHDLQWRGFEGGCYLIISEEMFVLLDKTDIFIRDEGGYIEDDVTGCFLGVLQDRWRVYQQSVEWNAIYIVPQGWRECIKLLIEGLI